MIGFGESLALVSAFSYAAAGVSVAKSASGAGTSGRGGDNGALLSIILTASVACAVWLLFRPADGVRYSDPAGLGWFALSGLLTIVLGRALYFTSIARIGAIRASAVNRLNPFFSVLLAALLLGEVIRPVTGLGMALIGVSFLILIRHLLAGLVRRETALPAPGPEGHVPSGLAYAFGPASALAYAAGYTARKFGLAHLPDSNFGTMIGALAGLAVYLVIALFAERHRAALRGLLTGTTRWHVMAALFISIGQLAQFAAIAYIEVSRVVMITSTEIFVAIFLSVYVLRTEMRPDPLTLLAAAVAGLGVVLITLG